MPVPRLADAPSEIAPAELIGALIPPPRFSQVRFSTYLPSPTEPGQAAALTTLEGFADRVEHPPRGGVLRRRRAAPVGGVYLDGGFGVGKTHLLASLWHAVPGPKAYGTFVEFTHLVGALGFPQAVAGLSGHRLVAVDEFELDDPGDTMLMTRLLGDLADAGVALAATSNTLPDKLGEGRFAADDFRREIRGLADRFNTVRIDGPDYRHAGLAPAPQPMADADLRRSAESTDGATLDDFGELTARLAVVHPSRYGRLVTGARAVHLSNVSVLTDQSAALRWVVLIDRLYDRTVPVVASGVSLDRLFPPDMLAGGYRKKYLRATSRLLALSREASAGSPPPAGLLQG